MNAVAKAWALPTVALAGLILTAIVALWATGARDRLAKAEADLVAVQGAGDRLAERQALLANSEPLFRAANVALAGAQLQTQALALAETEGLVVANCEILPPQGREIGLRLQVQGSEASLLRLLASMERAAPFIFVEDMKLAASDAAAGMLDLSLRVSAGYAETMP